MGFRSRQSNHDGFGIQKNSNRKTTSNNKVNKRKKKVKKPKMQNLPAVENAENVFVNIDEDAYQSTNPTITAAPNRLSNRDYYEKYLELLMGEEYDGELETIIDAVVNPQDGRQEVLSKLVQAFDFDEYDYDAANEFYRQDSTLAELGGTPEAYNLGDFFKIYGFMGRPRDFSDSRFERLRNFIEMTNDGKVRHIANKDVPKNQNATNLPVGEEISSTLPEGMASSMSPSTFDDKVQAELDLAQLNGYIEQAGITGEESKKLFAEYLMKELQNQNRMG